MQTNNTCGMLDGNSEYGIGCPRAKFPLLTRPHLHSSSTQQTSRTQLIWSR